MPIGAPPDISPVEGRQWTVPGPGGTPPAPGTGEIITARYRVTGADIFDAAGDALVNLGAAPFGATWVVERLVVLTTSVAATEVRVFVGTVADDAVVDLTPVGNGDVSEYPRGLYVGGSADLLVTWTGGDPGATARAAAQLAETVTG